MARNYFYGFIAVAAIATVSCNKEIENVNNLNIFLT